MKQQQRGFNPNKGLHWLNGKLDDFILELSKPLAMIGLVIGTVDIFLRGQIATQQWFSISWAIIQAVTIDGLFFAIWFRLFGSQWTKEKFWTNLAHLVVGVVLAILVGTTNGILSVQQLWDLKDSQVAMSRLNINPVWFTVVRAALVVFVLIMVAFTIQQKDSQATKMDQPGEPDGQDAPAVGQDAPEVAQPVANEPVAMATNMDTNLSYYQDQDGQPMAIGPADGPVGQDSDGQDGQGGQPQWTRDETMAYYHGQLAAGQEPTVADLVARSGRKRTTVRNWISKAKQPTPINTGTLHSSALITLLPERVVDSSLEAIGD